MMRAVISEPDALAPVVKRLEDAHRLWHQADGAYFDPESFRLAAQGMIQALRSVTFILQKNKSKIPGFDAWYPPWQEKLKSNSLMGWMVEARNKIEKEGDLEAKSYVRAEIVASYLDGGPSIEVPAQLFQTPIDLLKSIPSKIFREHVSKHGSLRIERKWIENTLPDYELLDALATAYGHLAEVVYSAHHQAGLPVPRLEHSAGGPKYDLAAMEWRMPCMIGHSTARSTVIALDSAKIVSLTKRTVPITDDAGAKVEKRYGTAVLSDLRASKSDTLEEVARAFFKMTRTIFLKDKYHQSMAMLLKDDKPVHIMAIPAETQAEKYLLMREVANEATRFGADAVFVIGEVWIAAADKLRPYQRPGDLKERSEALVLLLDSRAGKPRRLSAVIRRKGLRGRKVMLDPTEEVEEGSAFMLAPLYKAWGKAIPLDWVAEEERLLAAARSD